MSPSKPRHSHVAAGHRLVTEAGVQVLKMGGNAFDAAVAAGFAAALAEPGFTSLGGGGFLLAHTAAGRSIAFDFFADTPGRGHSGSELEPHFEPVTVRFSEFDQIFNVGLGSVAVPGIIRGFVHVQKKLGRIPLAEVLAPAITMARDGFAVDAMQADILALLEPINTASAAGRALFEPEGRAPVAGDRLVNPDTADLLEALVADGDRAFYEGEVAQAVATDMRDGGGLLTEKDLAAYRVVERKPLVLKYRGHRILTNPLPSRGGRVIGDSLKLHEERELSGLDWGSGLHLRRLVEVMRKMERRMGAGGTTHLSVSDAEGNAASLSISNGEGSGYIAPGTGIMLNNMMGEDDLHPGGFHAVPPGERVPSMMAPMLVMQDGAVRWVLGTGGSRRIRATLVQIVTHLIDFEKSLQDAVDAPRLYWDVECVHAERGYSEEAIEELREYVPVQVWAGKDLFFGGVHSVDTLTGGVGDARRGGQAATV